MKTEVGVKEIFSACSTNGRWGLAVVGPEGTKFPAQDVAEYLERIRTAARAA